MDEKNERLKASVLRNFFTAEGKLKHIPAQLKKKRIVLGVRLRRSWRKGRSYSEKELNAFIKSVPSRLRDDWREFIMHAYLYREQEIYERNPREMWERWETLA